MPENSTHLSSNGDARRRGARRALRRSRQAATIGREQTGDCAGTSVQARANFDSLSVDCATLWRQPSQAALLAASPTNLNAEGGASQSRSRHSREVATRHSNQRAQGTQAADNGQQMTRRKTAKTAWHFPPGDPRMSAGDKGQ